MSKNAFRAQREFGLIVGGVFLLLGAWWIYRGRFVTVAQAMAAGGFLLIVCGWLWPRALVVPNRAWMLLAEGLSFVTTPIILGIVFFVVMTPIGFVKRLSGWDPLNRRKRSGGSYWRPYAERQRERLHFEKMY
jgi:Saxitoxin biosynthesis operon protein SxtJ